jgi:hypothetical protein
MEVSTGFFRAAPIAALLGMGLGLAMGARQDFTLMPVHAHLNLLGWVSMMLFGLFYRLVPGTDAGFLPRLHLGLAVGGVALMVPALALVLWGHPGAEPAVLLGSFLTITGMAIFALVVFRATRRPTLLRRRSGLAEGHAD